MHHFIYIFSILVLMIPSHAGHFILSKELNEALIIKPIPDSLFKNNVYVDWMGFGYPGVAWQTVYREFFQKNDTLFNEQIRLGNTVVQTVSDPKKKSIEHLMKIGLMSYAVKYRHFNLGDFHYAA